MSGQLRDTASELAEVLWREHTVYRDRSGGVVIRGEHVQRWISLAPAGGRDEILIRAGRILEGGTTAPARSEAIVPLSAGTSDLAATCRRLLADAAADAEPRHSSAGPRRTAGPGKAPRKSKAAKRRTDEPRRHTSVSSWVVIACVVGLVGYYCYSVAATY
ncbi:hypothetical protein [Streptomyces sp. NPDC000410]|uniref:hypothetical protein n=1 Tax=Streptomyces sp. NPDC000410 TaxID=3154254 RepID=UPI00331C89FF